MAKSNRFEYNINALPQKRQTLTSVIGHAIGSPLSVVRRYVWLLLAGTAIIATILLLITLSSSAFDWWAIAEYFNNHLEQVLYVIGGGIIASATLLHRRRKLSRPDWVFFTLMGVIGFALPAFAFSHIVTPGAAFKFIIFHFEYIMYVTGVTFIISSTILWKMEYLLERDWVFSIVFDVFMLIIPAYMLTLE